MKIFGLLPCHSPIGRKNAFGQWCTVVGAEGTSCMDLTTKLGQKDFSTFTKADFLPEMKQTYQTLEHTHRKTEKKPGKKERLSKEKKTNICPFSSSFSFKTAIVVVDILL